CVFFFFQAEDGIRDGHVTGVQTCALPISGGVPVTGYEIRMGSVGGARRPALELDEGAEGAVSEDGWVVGTSVHGLLAGPPFRREIGRASCRKECRARWRP